MMIKKYELWLDESGSFEDAQAKQRHENPSLIGGLLIEKERAECIHMSELIPPERNHATEMTVADKKMYLIPTLERARDEYGARLFYIENPTYETEESNRELYLRMMAEGLLQLLQVLNALHESVELDVIIAQRQDFRQVNGRRRINEDEYIRKLQSCISKKKKVNHILLDEHTMLSFHLDSAYRNQKLELADYACYTRFRRKSSIFSEDQERLNALFEDAYLFRVIEIGTVSYINRLLSNGMVADAILEAFTTTELINRKAELLKICDRMKNMSYRQVKSQLKQFSADITAYAANEDDYEIGERLLKKIDQELMPLLMQGDFPYTSCRFQLLLQLTDMYLREGDILAARKTLDLSKTVQRNIGDALEGIFSYYQIAEKEAVLLINEFRYQEALVLMDRVCTAFEGMMNAVAANEDFKDCFGQMRSEYFGDALCMKLYAGLFLQRTDPKLYVQLCKDSELALKQYSQQWEESERHCQYRSHIEAEAGNYQKALQWLMQAKCHDAKDTGEDEIHRFLDAVEKTECRISCQYHLMYYLVIMAEAKRKEHPLADTMYHIMLEHQELLKMSEINLTEESGDIFEKVNISAAVPRQTGINYHPIEINQWKLASYLYWNGEMKKAQIYFWRAYQLCTRYPQYVTMRIVGLGVLAEMISCEIAGEMNLHAQEHYQSLLNDLEKLLEEPLPKATNSFLQELKECAASVWENGNLSKELLQEISRKIMY